LLKTKINKKEDRCRVGIRLRANPQNKYELTDIFVMIVLPLHIDGENVTMSRKGGVWDEMKRTLTWTIKELPAGDIIDIQAQFRCYNGVLLSMDEWSKFPVLARCNGDITFSRINMNSDYTEKGSVPVELEVERSATVLYRKV
jgi:hypothetical protein